MSDTTLKSQDGSIVESQGISTADSLRRACYLAGILCVVMTAHYLFKAGVGGVVLKAFGALRMPWFDLADAGLSALAVGGLFSIRALRVRLSLAVTVSAIVLSIALGLVGWFARPGVDDRAALMIVGLSGNLLVFAATYGVWMLLASTAFERSWATLTIVGLGAQAGVLAGSQLGKSAAIQGAVAWLPLLVSLLYILAFSLIGLGIRRFSCGGTRIDNTMSPEPITDRPAPPRVSDSQLARYLMMIFVLLLIGGVFGRAMNWRIQHEADYRQTVRETIGFLASFYQNTAVISLLCQAAITPLALRSFSSRWGLLFQPLFGIFVAGMLTVRADTAMNMVWIALFTSVDYTVYNAFKERLWLPTPLQTKVYHKAIASLLIPKLAAILNAVSVLVLASVSLQLWSGIVLGLAVGWMWLARRVGDQCESRAAVPVNEFRVAVDAV